MASLIMVIPKPNGNKKVSQDFFAIIDQYLKSQGWSMFDQVPRTYFMQKNIAPTRVREYINTVKTTNGYKEAVAQLYYSPSLQKG